MKRCLNDQEENVSDNNNSVKLTSDSYNSNNGPMSVSTSSGINFQQTATTSLKLNYSKVEPRITSTASSTPVTQTNQSYQTVPTSGPVNSTNSQIYSTDSSFNNKTVGNECVNLKVEENRLIHNNANSANASYTENMQSSVQSFPPQMQASYQLTTAPVSNHGGSPTSGQSMTSGTTSASQPSQVQAHQQHQMHQTQAHTTVQVPATPQQFQRLKVEDALSYLDKVKFKFGNQPQVYNDFLDIMKEFKSQSIDTPGVINRVSNLFKGHSELIVGFNTFLPPGYKIEVQSNEQVNFSVPGSGTPTILHPGNPALTQQQSTSFYAAVDAEVVKRLMMFQAPAVSTVHSNQSERTQSVSTSINGPQHSYHQSNSPLSPISSNHSSPHHGNNSQSSQQSQPVEFNHAINYVNKIKNRFHEQPDIYKQFLEILHTYQKEQRHMKEGITSVNKPLTESEVYSQVAKLFQNQEDLLQEFGQFLPDANGAAVTSAAVPTTKAIVNDHSSTVKKISSFNKNSTNNSTPQNHQANRLNQQVKRPSTLSHLQSKKPRISSQKDISFAEAGKYGSLNEYAYFDKVRKALKSQEIYENFLRCLVLFNEEIISRVELVQLVSPFLGKYPELFKWFKDFVGYKDTGTPTVEAIPSRIATQERMGSDWEMEVDYSSCKRYGASYRALPKFHTQPKCSGRTALCKEVLNDTLVSFPTWSEDSTFVSSRKTQFEEYIYRCEDERFELDVVLETNLATIKVLEAVHKKIMRMSPDESAKFRLDDTLGGTSETIHQRSIRRIYGEKASDIIDGLKRNPSSGVPVVLKRLKAKEEEWREAQKGFNKIWRDQNEKYYLKSLDHQGINFKQNDMRNLRSKNFLNEIEVLYEERHDQMEEGATVTSGPHLTLQYKDKSILDDVANLIIHHVKRLTGVHKEDKQKMKQTVKHVIPDLFFHPRQDLSEDEGDKDDDDTDELGGSDIMKAYKDSNNSAYSSGDRGNKQSSKRNNNSNKENSKHDIMNGEFRDSNKSFSKIKMAVNNLDSDEAYNLIFGNNNWYLFLRLHHVLCERLTKMFNHAVQLAEEESKDKMQRKDATSKALRLQPKQDYEVEEYYPALLDMVKNVLDGNLENTQFEDTLRDMFGINAYIAFSLDKVVINIVRQLQHLVCDDSGIQCTELFYQESKTGGAGGLCSTALQRAPLEASYQRRVEQKLADENCYKIHTYKKECKVAIELLDTDSDESEDPIEVEKWSEYVEKYVGDETISDELKEQLSKKPVFLPRNIRTWRQRAKRQNLKRINDKEKSNLPDDMMEKSDENDSGRNISDDVDILDNTQCKFNLHSFKMVFVVNSESFLYKHSALQRASKSHKKVSQNLNSKFRNWHQQWCVKNLTENQEKMCQDWLLGKSDGLVPNVTERIDNNDQNKPPYSPYNRYKVEIPVISSIS